MSRIHKGIFKPKHPEKYKGNANNIWYRSGLEFTFYSKLDNEDWVLEWNSEELAIPYISPVDHKQHRYFPDCWIKAKTKTGIHCFLVEIKPYSQCSPPKAPKRRTRRFLKEVATYAVNDAKWAAAKALCQKQGWKWKVITEKEIYGTKNK